MCTPTCAGVVLVSVCTTNKREEEILFFFQIKFKKKYEESVDGWPCDNAVGSSRPFPPKKNEKRKDEEAAYSWA